MEREREVEDILAVREREDKERDGVYSYLTEREKSPWFFLLGRARKLPWMPRLFKTDSASKPEISLWNHLDTQRETHYTHIHTVYTNHTHTDQATHISTCTHKWLSSGPAAPVHIISLILSFFPRGKLYEMW